MVLKSAREIGVELPSAETMLTYASILEKPQYYIHKGIKFRMPESEIIKAAIAALRYCAANYADDGG